MKYILILIAVIVMVNALHFEQNQIIRLRRALASTHVRAKRQLLGPMMKANGTMKARVTVKGKTDINANNRQNRPPTEKPMKDESNEDYHSYDPYHSDEYFHYPIYDMDDYYDYDPFGQAVHDSFRQHLMAYPNGRQHIACVEECASILAEIDKFDSNESSDDDPYELLFANNPTGDKDGQDFTINISGELPPFWDILGNGSSKFDEARFNDMCTSYKTGVNCVYKCPYGFFTRLVNSVFRPIEYMCDVAKSEYVKYASCAEKADVSVCKNQCPSPTSNRTVETLEDGRDTLSEMCGYIECQTSCASPQIQKACDGDKKAAEVFEQTVDQVVGAVVDLTQLLGFAPGPVGMCVDIVANMTILPSQENMKPPLELLNFPQPRPSRPRSTIELQVAALQLQLMTLNIVKAQKELINLDLQNAYLANQIKEQLDCPKDCSGFSK